MEISFTQEIKSLRLGAGSTLHGEGILAITKALLQSGVAYVGGYQGAPVSHLLDVMVQAKPYMDELGVHVEACSNEASAAAMLGASIHYPLRGAVTWKSIVGTNVAETRVTETRVRSQYCSVMVNCKRDADDWDLAVAGPCIEGCSRLAPVWAMSGHDKHRASCAA